MNSIHRYRARARSVSRALCLVVCAACSGLGGSSTVTEMRPGSICAGSTTDTQGAISVTHFWTVELTETDAVFNFDDRRVVLQGVVGNEPLKCRGNQQTGKAPDVVLELAGGRTARWKGFTIDLGEKHYDIEGPGTFVIDSNGTMRRQ
jgi:hypothetical protein